MADCAARVVFPGWFRGCEWWRVRLLCVKGEYGCGGEEGVGGGSRPVGR